LPFLKKIGQFGSVTKIKKKSTAFSQLAKETKFRRKTSHRLKRRPKKEWQMQSKIFLSAIYDLIMNKSPRLISLKTSNL